MSVEDGDVDDLRTLMRGLVLKGQRRVHMKKEGVARKHAVAAAICGAGVTATVYDAGRYHDELAVRARCLAALVADLTAGGGNDTLVVLEQDDSLVGWDRRQLYALTRAARHAGALRYEHRRGGTEPLLAVPDAIAWCWAKGGGWRRRIAPAVTSARHV